MKFLNYIVMCIIFFLTFTYTINANNCTKWLLVPMESGLHSMVNIYDKNITKPDLDCDGTIDTLDQDIDGDGVPNEVDDFPLNASETTDTDGDGIGDNKDRPVANAQTITIKENSHKNAITLSGNDDSDNITFTLSAQPKHGTLSGTAPNLTFTPDSNYSGSDHFSFITNDGSLNSFVATVTIIIDSQTSNNAIPIGVNDHISTTINTVINIDVLNNDRDDDNDTLSIRNLSVPAHGNVSISSNIVVYTPNANWHGTDTFTYRPYDGKVVGNSTTVTVRVTPILNTVPIGVDDNVSTTVGKAIQIDVLKNDRDENNDTLSIRNLSVPRYGSISLSSNVVVYTPNANWHGTDTFTYRPYDGKVVGNSTTVTVRVTPILNTAPIGVDDNVSTTVGKVIQIDVLKNDRDENNDTLSIKNLSVPRYGSISLSSNVVVYTPNANWHGTDTFTYRPYDGKVVGNSTTVTVRVTPIPNKAPVGVNDYASTPSNKAVQIDVLKNDHDVDGDTLIIMNLSTPAHGSLSFSSNVVVYTPHANWSGTDTFTYKPYDGKVMGNSTTVTVVVILEERVEDKIVKRHNVYRNLDFTDSNLTWDTTLAQHAQQWANYLASHYTLAHRNAGQSPHASAFNASSHGLSYKGEGENIAWSSKGAGYLTPNPVDITVEGAGEGGAIDSWANEKAHYDYPNNATTIEGKAIGHYTQVVWQKTTKVGCGKANSTTDLGGEHVVCRYYIPGNSVGNKPYCTQYSVAQYYNDNTLKFTDAIINGKTFVNTKVLEDRANCIVSDVTGETLVVHTNGTGTFYYFDFFNDGGYVANFNFNKTIDANGVLQMTGVVNGNNSRIILKLIGQDATYYYADAEWTLNISTPRFTRRAIFKLTK